jgi:hypothetical protein
MKSKSETFSGHVVRRLITDTAMHIKINLQKCAQSKPHGSVTLTELTLNF